MEVVKNIKIFEEFKNFQRILDFFAAKQEKAIFISKNRLNEYYFVSRRLHYLQLPRKKRKNDNQKI
jgi:hypothetical protein